VGGLKNAAYKLYRDAYPDKTSFLYWDGDGEITPRRGSATRAAFWDGYNGLPNTKSPRGSVGAAAWAAGRDCKIEEANDV